MHHGADSNEPTADGITPFEIASTNRHVEVTRLLLAFGANAARIPQIQENSADIAGQGK